VLDQFFTGIADLEASVEYWGNPANLYYEIVVKNSKEMIYLEYTVLAFGSLGFTGIIFAIFSYVFF
jgi:hypothetical protein